MLGGDFLAKIKLILEGKDATVSGLQQTEQAYTSLNRTITQKAATVMKAWGVDTKSLATGSELKRTLEGQSKAQKDLANNTQQSFQQMGDFEKAMRRVILVAPVWMIFRAALQSVLKLIGEQVKFLIDLEDAMTRIKIVGKGIPQEYEDLRTTLVGLGMTYGVVASAAAEAAVIFAQQGKSVSEVIKLTRTAMIGSQVLGADIKATVENLTAAMKAFNISADDSVSIIDKLINVERNYAVTSKDLADAIKVVGATANQMGVSIDALVGDVTAVVEVTRKTGAEAARGLQFIYARLLTTGAKAIQQTAQVPIYLDKQGQATFEVTDKYRSLTAILDDTAEKWGKLTNTEQLNIAANVASKRQLSVFMALMQNYDASIKARITSLTAAGEAEKAFGLIQDTTSYKLKVLTSTWNNLTLAIGDTTAFKTALDSLAELLQYATALINIYQAMRNEGQKVIDAKTKETETFVSQRQALIELIKMRNEYLTRIPTDKNTEILARINKAIFDLQKSGGFSFDFNAKGITEQLEKEIDQLKRQKIIWDIDVKTDLKKAELTKQIDNLKKATEKTSPFFVAGLINELKKGKFLKELEKKQEELKELEANKTAEIEKQTAEYEAQKTKKEAEATLNESDLNSLKELLQIDQDRIEQQSKLNVLKQAGVLSNQQLLDLEIKLTKENYEQLEPYEQKLKIKELEEKRSEAILKDIQKQISIGTSLLRIAGEQESTIIRQEMALKAMMYGEDYLKNSMEDRVRLAQALTKEADEQEKSSSKLVELFKIAQKYGKQVAQEVSEFMGGLRGFTELSPQAMTALKKTSPGEFERGRAQEFFRGTNFAFPEAIEKERKRERDVQIAQTVMIEPIQINVDLQSEEVIDKTKQAIINALNDKKSELSQKIRNQIENY